MGGGSKKLSSVYNNNNGVSKTHSKIYANINSSNKIIFEKEYTWAKYTWKCTGSKSYTMGSYTSSKTTTLDYLNYHKQYLFRNCTPTSDNTYKLSNSFSFEIDTKYSGVTNSLIKYLVINGTQYLVYKQYSDSNWHSISNGISYKISGNDEYISFPTCYSTTIGDLTDSASSDPYSFTMDYYDNLYVISSIYWNGPNSECKVTYGYYGTPSYTYLWTPDTVQYVTSTNQNAYTENNTSINVNNSYNYGSNTTFPYNPTYRFLG